MLAAGNYGRTAGEGRRGRGREGGTARESGLNNGQERGRGYWREEVGEGNRAPGGGGLDWDDPCESEQARKGIRRRSVCKLRIWGAPLSCNR
eukprot:760647-Hanusia_phi.AAC.5